MAGFLAHDLHIRTAALNFTAVDGDKYAVDGSGTFAFHVVDLSFGDSGRRE